EQRQRLIDAVSGDAKSMVLLYCHRQEDYDMEPGEVRLREGDRLLAFGLRHDNEVESLWVAVVEIPGIDTVDAKEHYDLRHGPGSNYDSCYDIGKSDYAPGAKFEGSCRRIKVNNGTPVKRSLS